MEYKSSGFDGSAASVGNRCRRCGSAVSERFASVFGDNDDVIHRCLDCSTMSRLSEGAGAGRNGEVGTGDGEETPSSS
jgi:hypothetical protein